MSDVDYGSYVPRGFIAGPVAAGIVSLLGCIKARERIHRLILGGMGAALLFTAYWMSFVHFLYRDERKVEVREALLDLLPWDGWGRALDIGTGSGLLAIGLAKRYGGAAVVGTDIWKWSHGAGSGLTKKRADSNAMAEGVGDRVEFVRGDARELPFEDDSFDAVVTHEVWHNIMIRDRYELIEEGLRVLKRGGAFMFADPFQRRTTYGGFDKLMARIKDDVDWVKVWDVRDLEVEFSLLERYWMCVLYGVK